MKEKKSKQWKKNSKRRISSIDLSKQQYDEAIRFYHKYAKIDGSDHAFYTSCTGIFSVKYLPDWIYYGYIDAHFNDWDYAVKLDNKCFYSVMFPKCNHPDTIAYRVNGMWFSADRKLLSHNELSDIIEGENALFVKAAVYSNGGHGVERIEAPHIFEKAKKILSRTNNDLVIQRPIVQAPTLHRINPSSVNTIRILSVLNGAYVKIYSMILRMGVGNSFVDNASSGGITVGIQEDGTLRSVAYDKNGNRFLEHPTSGIIFSEVTIPNIEKIKDLVVNAHPMVPHFRMVSWDIALDNNQPVLIEANLKDGELDFHQLNNGPLFDEDTEMILDGVFKK